MANFNALLFYDKNNGVGLGHFSRINALCFVLKSLGFTPKSFDSLNFDSTLKKLESNGEKLAIIAIDSYTLPLESYKRAANASKICIFFDDFTRLDYPQGIIVNGTNADISAYKAKYKKHILFLGSQYRLLQPPFLKALNKNPKKLEGEIKSILITLGGSDILGLNDLLCATLAKDYKIHCISKEPINLVTTHYNLSPEQMKELILSVNLCICACGQSLAEILSCGIPAIALEVAPNQSANLQDFSHCTLNLPKAYTKNKEQILNFITTSLESYKDLNLQKAHQQLALKVLKSPSKWKMLKELI